MIWFAAVPPRRRCIFTFILPLPQQPAQGISIPRIKHSYQHTQSIIMAIILRISAVINSEEAFTRYCLSYNSSVTHQAGAVYGSFKPAFI